MACDATARLYDVDEDSVIFRKLQQTDRYDQGTVTFKAREGELIDLDKLHESIWATRLSGGTRSGLVSLQVNAVGEVVESQGRVVLKVANSDAEFILQPDSRGGRAAMFDELKASLLGTGKIVNVKGIVANYSGRWPDVLSKRPASPREIVVTGFETREQP